MPIQLHQITLGSSQNDQRVVSQLEPYQLLINTTSRYQFPTKQVNDLCNLLPLNRQQNQPISQNT